MGKGQREGEGVIGKVNGKGGGEEEEGGDRRQGQGTEGGLEEENDNYRVMWTKGNQLKRNGNQVKRNDTWK